VVEVGEDVEVLVGDAVTIVVRAVADLLEGNAHRGVHAAQHRVWMAPLPGGALRIVEVYEAETVHAGC